MTLPGAMNDASNWNRFCFHDIENVSVTFFLYFRFSTEAGRGQGVVTNGVHAFCSRTHEIFANCWVDEWTTYDHDFAPEASDAFLDWFFGMRDTIEKGYVRSDFQNGWAYKHYAQSYFFDVRAGGHLKFEAWWYTDADLDITIYDENGRWVGGGYSWSNSAESVDIEVPSSGVYQVKVRAYRGRAESDTWAQVDVDPNITGRFELPVDKIKGINTNLRGQTLDQPEPISSRIYDIDVDDGTHAISLELQWADPGIDLDLFLLDGKERVVAYSSDRNTNYEFISYKLPSAGRYRIEVKTHNLSGLCEYSLTGHRTPV